MGSERRIGHWLDARAWLDEDGHHVWLQHECVHTASATMLPWPRWRADGSQVRPSINCGLCGLHVFVPIGPAPMAASS